MATIERLTDPSGSSHPPPPTPKGPSQGPQPAKNDKPA